MRSLSTIGWFVCQAIGTMQLDRDASPLGLVARAWAADTGSHPVEVGIDWGRRGGKAERMRQMKKALDAGHIEMHRLSTQTRPLMRAFQENTNVSE